MKYITESRAAIATSTSNCNRPLVLLDLALPKFLRSEVRCQVQIISEELELDASELPTPKNCPIIELMVLDASRATIEQIVASIPEYQSYKVVDYWQVIDDESPF